MNHEFWHAIWAVNQTEFHLNQVNPLLTLHWSQTRPNADEKVLVPLCGKSEDLEWLASRHHEVIGVELSEIAVRSYFAERFYTPVVTKLDGLHCLYQFDELSLYLGDVFSAPLPAVDIIYDREALVSVSPEQRPLYAERLLGLLNPGGRVLLISYEHHRDDRLPPFSVDKAEIMRLFAGCQVNELQRIEKGPDDYETVWLIETAPQ